MGEEQHCEGCHDSDRRSQKDRELLAGGGHNRRKQDHSKELGNKDNSHELCEITSAIGVEHIIDVVNRKTCYEICRSLTEDEDSNEQAEGVALKYCKRLSESL